ncbi:hypothetical protein CPC08DRAFT_426491 [Agrocybe pediades]|nr:hypothetical protein CPC08DRAFT_426491 [Agrocybe pediades]
MILLGFGPQRRPSLAVASPSTWLLRSTSTTSSCRTTYHVTTYSQVRTESLLRFCPSKLTQFYLAAFAVLWLAYPVMPFRSRVDVLTHAQSYLLSYSQGTSLKAAKLRYPQLLSVHSERLPGKWRFS